MNPQTLTELALKGESEVLEFKTSTGQRTEGAKAVCAMLNGVLGGLVLFGVNDRGDVVGQPTSARTVEHIVAELNRIEPPAFPDIETVVLENGHAVIVVRVSGGSGLYTYDGRPYQRVGPTTRIMPRRRYERLLLERMHASHRWENRPAESMDFSDLDHQEISRTIDEAIRRQRMDDPGTRDPRDLLLGLGLIQDGRLLNAGWSHGDVSTDVSNVSNDVSNNVSKIFLGEAPGGPDSSPDETRRAVGAGDLQSGASRASSIFLGADWPNAQGRAMRIHFDESAHALYIWLGDSPIVESEEVHPGVVLDFNADDRVVGIEVLKVTDRAPAANLRQNQFEVD